MSDYVRCKRCGGWGWTGELAGRYGAHACPPIWEARILKTRWENDWTEVHARDAEDAASKFCERYDSDGEYSIIQDGGAEIEVRKLGEDQITQVEISAESVPTYYAHARPQSEPALKAAESKK